MESVEPHDPMGFVCWRTPGSVTVGRAGRRCDPVRSIFPVAGKGLKIDDDSLGSDAPGSLCAVSGAGVSV